MKLYLLRHGKLQIDGQWRFIGQTDTKLSLEGISQAYWWKEQFRKEPIEAIFSSPLSRASQTAEIISDTARIPVYHLPDLSEINLGDWEGLTRSEVQTYFPGQWDARGNDLAKYRPPNGESFADLHQRVLPAIGKIIDSAMDNILVVSHAGVIRVVLCHYLGVPLQNMMHVKQDYGALNTIEYHDALPRLTGVNRLPGNHS